ncbi:MAG: hypothetical protein A2X61_00740 [Ignavibacteria bacterium GWB2_35_12]|nr:MAG: hypothetical protein A2X61_00740 [Ignavibacteria bacterium GWB2_35_12]OGU95718.1 MAG: hypothetical protein A2220_03005 [Ignavibacteria bacterium RIFOXYA2_FULL_35_10]OGV21719.1 MAG: hypothetical protein A2475_03965 [Ignavibacteria bacterium RIFOXYC2_FULL_35_21]
MANNRIVGVLWEKHKDGNAYYSGVLRDLHGDVNIAVFPNNKKQNEKQPDFNIVISFGNKKNGKPQTEETTAKKSSKKKDDDDLPF